MTLNNLAINLDKLAVMVKKGFDDVDEKLGKLESGQESMLSRLDNLEKGQTAIIDNLNTKAEVLTVFKLTQRVDKIEKKMGIN